MTRFSVIPAVYLILKKEGKILLMKRMNSGYCDGMYSLPAGHLDGGETAKSGMAREANEELGISFEDIEKDLNFYHVIHRLNKGIPFDERIDLFFTANKWIGTPKNMEKSKCDNIEWFPIDNLPINLIPNVRHVILNEEEYYTELEADY